ncbi:GGDEF domain-containing protein [Candidatus Woesearchaeota archaeon]|nr:GGDEF domain-containing protein [Candidatus Woesearchaeota archaeon]
MYANLRQSDLILLLEFADLMAKPEHLETAAKTAAEFLTRKLALENCTLHYASVSASAYALNGLDAVDKAVKAQVVSQNAVLTIANIRTDFLLGKVSGAENFPWSVLALPLRASDAQGMIALYAQNNITHMTELASLLATRLVSGLEKSRRFQDAKHSAVTDALTGCYNKAFFQDALTAEITRAKAFQRPTSLLMFDIDNFKQFNDTYGHPAGDELLRGISQAVRTQLGPVDLFCRYGGEEFVAIMPELPADQAVSRAEGIRAAVDNYDFSGKHVTISIGLLSCLNSSVSGATMLKEADRLLYKAKGTGKNKVCRAVILDKSLGVIDA